MLHSGLSRAFAAFLACTAFCGCANVEPAAEVGTGVLRGDTRTGTMATVVFHVTGLALLVPSDGKLNILLPNGPTAPPSEVHYARLGFGILRGNPDKLPCVDDSVFSSNPTDHGICYINLSEWSLDPFGAGGEFTPIEQELPAGLLNVSDISGGHGVLLPADPGDYVATLALESGWPGNHCSLARWTYAPVTADGTLQTPVTHPLINATEWRIRVSDSGNYRLRFRRKTDPTQVVEAELPPPRAGKIELILAHVPLTDLGHLPPAKPPSTPGGSFTATHFDYYYNLLRGKDGKKPTSGYRPQPYNGTAITTKVCRVAITTPEGPFVEPAAIATYACMPASGNAL